MRKLLATAAAGIAVLGWSAQGIANPDPHPTTAPKDDHKGEHKDGEHKDNEHKDGHGGDHHAEGKDDHKPAH